MTDAQERFEKACELAISSEPRNERCRLAFYFEKGWQAALSHPTPQRDEQITRILDQLKSGVGTFLQGEGEKLASYVEGLEANGKQTQALYEILNNLSVRTATTFPGKTETFAEAVEWMKKNVIDDLVRKQAEIDRLGVQVAERDALISKAKSLIDEQAEDDGLWFVAETITETQLQKALRKLSAIIEETDDFGIPLKEPKP